MGTCCSSQNADKPKLPQSAINRGPSNNRSERGSNLKDSTISKLDQKVNFVPANAERAESNVKDRVGKARGERKIKGKVIFNDKDGDVLKENITQIDKKMARQDVEFVIISLMKHFFFRNLSDDELENVIAKMFYCVVNQGEYVFKQGDDATCFFIIDKGEVNVEINNKVKKKMGNSEGFGDLALLYNAPRSASIQARTDTYFWAIDRKTFKKVVSEITAKQYRENRLFLDKVSFFKSMTETQKDAIASVLISQKFDNGQVIVNQGDQADSYYIIKKGKVVCVDENTKREVRILNEGESFGEQALHESSERGLTVKAKENDVRCVALSREALQNILGAKINEVVNSNWSRWALKKDSILKKLTNVQMERLIKYVKFRDYKDGEKLQKAGNTISKLMLFISGSAIFGEKEYDKGSAFSSDYLYPDENLEKPLENNLIATGNCTVATISIKKFHSIIGGSVTKVLKKNKNSHEAQMKRFDDKFRDAVANLKLKDLYYVKKLGEGQFGHVFLCQSKQDGKLYALKAVSKAQITEQNLEKHTLQEKAVLKKVNFKFIMRMYRTFKDDDFVYFLLSFVKGMELFDVIRQIEMDLLSNEASQFYIGSMLLAIEYLHRRNIVYRDIKPENIMVDEEGYLVLIDMGTAKILKEKNGINRTYTILGTPHYMAPEILQGKGYGLLVDLWSIGITLYEFMCGLVPFGEESEDPYEVYQLITAQNLHYPSYFLSNKENKLSKKMIERLLNRNSSARLGGSYAALKAHPWFDNFDWDKLHDKKLKPPYRPPSSKLMSNQEIKKVASMKIPVIKEIAKTVNKFRKSTVMNPSMPNWDKDFAE